jgi:transcriptional regulator with XRE-family HTH domain
VYAPHKNYYFLGKNMAWQKTPTEAELALGKRIALLRKKRDMTYLQVGRIVNEKIQQLERYEKGALVPVVRLEHIAEALGSPIQKRIIRKIVFLRKLEKETSTIQEELIDIYNSLFVEDLEDKNE